MIILHVIRSYYFDTFELFTLKHWLYSVSRVENMLRRLITHVSMCSRYVFVKIVCFSARKGKKSRIGRWNISIFERAQSHWIRVHNSCKSTPATISDQIASRALFRERVRAICCFLCAVDNVVVGAINGSKTRACRRPVGRTTFHKMYNTSSINTTRYSSEKNKEINLPSKIRNQSRCAKEKNK